MITPLAEIEGRAGSEETQTMFTRDASKFTPEALSSRAATTEVGITNWEGLVLATLGFLTTAVVVADVGLLTAAVLATSGAAMRAADPI